MRSFTGSPAEGPFPTQGESSLLHRLTCDHGCAPAFALCVTVSAMRSQMLDFGLRDTKNASDCWPEIGLYRVSAVAKRNLGAVHNLKHAGSPAEIMVEPGTHCAGFSKRGNRLRLRRSNLDQRRATGGK